MLYESLGYVYIDTNDVEYSEKGNTSSNSLNTYNPLAFARYEYRMG